MPEIDALPSLLCSTTPLHASDPDCELSQILAHLSTVLRDALRELAWLGGEDAGRIALYGPFLARTLLEVGVTALVGRFDPTRLLVVKKTQQHTGYDTQQPWNSAIRWQGDIVDEKVTDLWVPKRHYKEMTKALFGDYYVAIYWAEAVRRLGDAGFTGGTWLAELQQADLPRFSSSRRDTLTKLYTESSKGIHAEFVVPPGAVYDRATVGTLATRTIQVLAELGLMINLLPHIPYRLMPSEAIAHFNEVEDLEIFP